MTEKEPDFFQKILILIAVPVLLAMIALFVFGGCLLFGMALMNLGGMYAGEGEMSIVRFLLDVAGGVVGFVMCLGGMFLIYGNLTKDDKK